MRTVVRYSEPFNKSADWLTGADRGQQSEHSQRLAGPGTFASETVCRRQLQSASIRHSEGEHEKGCLSDSVPTLKECERAKEKHEKEAYLDPAKVAACAHCNLPKEKKLEVSGWIFARPRSTEKRATSSSRRYDVFKRFGPVVKRTPRICCLKAQPSQCPVHMHMINVINKITLLASQCQQSRDIS